MKELESFFSALRDITSALAYRIHKLETQEQEPIKIDKADSSADLTLTSSLQDIPDAELVLTPGVYAVIAAFHVRTGADVNDNTFLFEGHLDIEGIDQAGFAVQSLSYTAGVERAEYLVSYSWRAEINADSTVKLRARKTGGTGTSEVLATNTYIMATRLSIIG